MNNKYVMRVCSKLSILNKNLFGAENEPTLISYQHQLYHAKKENSLGY